MDHEAVVERMADRLVPDSADVSIDDEDDHVYVTVDYTANGTRKARSTGVTKDASDELFELLAARLVGELGQGVREDRFQEVVQ